MKKILLSIFAVLILVICIVFSISDKKQYAVAVLPTVLYGTENIFQAYKIENDQLVSRDNSGLVREIEAQSFPDSILEVKTVKNINGTDVYGIRSDEYWMAPEDFLFYIDSRAVKLVDKKPKYKKEEMPSKEEMLKKLYEIKAQTEKDLIPYVWGGNILEGVPAHKDLYGQGIDLNKLSKEDKKQFFLRGLDCTGLLYYITKGNTPRNSSWLRTYGEGLDIENKNIDEVISMVEPLDVVVHQGHIFLILNKEYTIESRLSKGGGVVITPIKERFKEVFDKKVPLNLAPQEGREGSWFVIRRFI